MSGFQVPFSSSPPSTPDRRSKDGTRQYSFDASNLSTTPAGLPPSSAGSFTPAGPPPSSVLGSSILDERYNGQSFPSLNFSKDIVLKPHKAQKNTVSSSPSGALDQPSKTKPHLSNLRHRNNSSTTKTRAGGFSANLEDDDDDDDDDDAEHDYEEDNMVEDQNDERIPEHDDYSDESDGKMDDNLAGDGFYDDERDTEDLRFRSSGPDSRNTMKDYSPSQRSGLLRRGQGGDLIDFRVTMEDSLESQSKDFIFSRIAKDMCNQLGNPQINESDDLVIGTEELIMRLYEDGITATEDKETLNETLAIIPAELLKLWAEYASTTSAHITEEYAAAIGPGPTSSSFTKANFLANLLLRLRHPGLTNSANISENLRSSLQRSSLSAEVGIKVKQIPLLLLEWMDDYHDPYPSQLEEIQRHKPSPANHRLFWDTILNSLLRGRVVAVVNALKTAGWRHTRNTEDDVRDKGSQVGYTGIALNNIEKVIHDAVQALQQCPAMRGDWNVRGSDWTLFRLRIDQALENLKRFAEGRNRDSDIGISTLSTSSQSYTGIAKRAESQVPWNIYQNLLAMYSLVLGDASTIVENSQDWCEASIGLVVWWNPGRDDQRLTIRRSTVSTEEAGPVTYLAKLTESFYRATAESTDFQVNTLNPIEVGLASLFESNSEAVISFLQSWSGPVSSAVAEIAALGGWLPHVASQSLISMDGLDQDDMNVLGLQSTSNRVEGIKDRTLIAYASALAERGQIKSTTRFGYPKTVREGWEIAIEVLGRLDSVERSEQEVGHLLSDFPFDSGANVNKLSRLLNSLGMTTHAENVAEKYADSLGKSSYKYGEALWYYALAHKPKRVKDVLNLLISLSLINSLAFPPEGEMDSHLQRLISTPKSALTEMSKIDFEAAQLLQKMLSGYATVRKFYDLRDEGPISPSGEIHKRSTHVRKAEAASVLMAVVTSADDNIRGGLYDEAREAVVSVDFLLALLGEAMVFVNQPQLVLTPSHINTLLKAIEDLQTVPPRIYSSCNEFLQTVMASTQGLKGSSPLDLLKKSTSSISGTSSFSLVGSSMVASQLQQAIGNSGVMVKGDVKRGWDWRRGLSADTTSEDILKILRFGLAKDLARAWILEADGQV